VAHSVLNGMHVMLGRDLHIPWPPGSPAPAAAAVPYVTADELLGRGLTCLRGSRVTAEGRSVMLRGTDIGPFIVHAGPPSLTLPIELMTSGSKSHFAASSIQLRDQHGKAGHLAGAVLGTMGINLNCGTPSPTAGAVIAPTTVRLGMRVGDLVSGLAGMATDYMLQRIAARAGELGAHGAGGIVTALGRRLGAVALGRVAARFAAQSGVRGTLGAAASVGRDVVTQNLARVATGVRLWGSGPLGFVIGAPLGASVSNVRGPDGEVTFPSALDRATEQLDRLGGATDDAVRAYLEEPSVSDIPFGPSLPGSPA
jgi:hypothetical protein